MEELYRSRKQNSVMHQSESLMRKFEESLTTTYSKILEFQARAVCHLHKHSVSRLLKGIFNPDEWERLLVEIRLSEESLQNFTSLIDISEIRQRFEDIQKTVECNESWRRWYAREEKVKTFLKALYNCPYKDRKDRNSEHVPGTCQWFTSHPLFQHWNSSQGSSLLWVSADPGCGKSVLAKYLIDHVLPSDGKRTTCYFFFKDDFTDQRSATSAFCAILRQIFLNKPYLIDDLTLRKFDIDGEKFLHSPNDLWSTVIKVAEDQPAEEIVCILDALDECQQADRLQLIRFLSKFFISQPKKLRLKFLLTSRPYDHIRREFQELKSRVPTIHLSGDDEVEVEKIAKEIDLVIKDRVQEIGRKRSLTPDESFFFEEQLIAVPNRTYLWVTLVMDVIENIYSITRGNVRRVISQLPQTVDDAYESILNRSSDKIKAKLLLHIVTAAKRPLTLAEMSIALAIEEHHKSNDDIQQEMEPEVRFRSTLRDLCGLFVVIVDGKVYLLHQTAKEFLVRGKPSVSSNQFDLNSQHHFQTWKHSLAPKKSSRILAERCVWILSIEFVTLQFSQMLEYFKNNWVGHFRDSEIDSEDAIVCLARDLCDPKSDKYQYWEGTSRHAAFVTYPRRAESIHIACFRGLGAVVEQLLRSNAADGSSKDEEHRTPLWYAVRSGDDRTVSSLLASNKTDVNTMDIHGLSPLFLAIKMGREALAKRLVESGLIDVNTTDKDGSTPLCWAVEFNKEAIVKLLLAHDQIEVNSLNRDGQTPLWLALKPSHRRTSIALKLLANDQTDVNMARSTGRTPLHWAISHKNIAVFNTLLNTDRIDVNLTDLDGMTPLALAAKHGHDKMVKLLLANDQTDVNLASSTGRTPLHWTISHKNIAVFNTLLNTDRIDVNLTDLDGMTPLAIAARHGQGKMVELLLATEKVDVNIADITGCTPLGWAIMREHKHIAKALLATGRISVNWEDNMKLGRSPLCWAGVNWKDRLVRSPLCWAAANGHGDIVRLLIAADQFNAEMKDDKFGRAPLSWAAGGGHLNVVKLLVAVRDLDVDSKDNIFGRTPLSWAAKKGHDRTVRVLLATRQVNADSKDAPGGQTPLSYAAQYGHEAVVKLLLDTGQVEPDSRDIHHRTPLSYAAANGHLEVVKILLETGKVDSRKKDRLQRTPISLATANGHEMLVKLMKSDTNDYIKPEDVYNTACTALNL
jgi:ankyrin repeat domain-containing protein 50